MRFRILFLCLFFVGCSDSTTTDTPKKLSAVDQYAVSTFQSTWDSLRTGSATLVNYVGGPNEGEYSIPLPFDFPYDGGVVAEGTMISVGANGAVSLTNDSIPAQQLVGDVNRLGVLAPFQGDLKQGGDAQAGVADTMGLYQVNGTEPNRTLTIEYRAFHLRGGGSGTGTVDTMTSMQVKLYETTGVIEFIYRDHGLDLPTKFPPRMCIGLNGLSASSFASKTYAKDTKVIPVTDLRWSPSEVK
jgi:hypothetical protein